MAAFFTKQIPSDKYNESKVIDLDALCDEYKKNFMTKNINKNTNALMREAGDAACKSNRHMETGRSLLLHSYIIVCLTGVVEQTQVKQTRSRKYLANVDLTFQRS